MREQSEIGTFADSAESERTKWTDCGFLEQGGALPDDGFVKGHCKGQRVAEQRNAVANQLWQGLLT